MQVHKVTISISESLFKFIELYQTAHQFKNRSEVISRALRLLQQKQLEADYLAANQEIGEEFDISAGDGLDDETW